MQAATIHPGRGATKYVGPTEIVSAFRVTQTRRGLPHDDCNARACLENVPPVGDLENYGSIEFDPPRVVSI